MKYRRLGRTSLQVSEISLGTAEIGQDYGIPVDHEQLRPTKVQAVRLLNRALDMGVNFVDTARVYGESEAIIGRALKKRRGEYVLASKVASEGLEGLTGKALRQRVQSSIRESLRALQTDVIDLMYIHSATPEIIKRREVLEILQEAQRAGHIRFVGASTYGKQNAIAVIEDGGYDCLQVAYNLLDRGPEQMILSKAGDEDVGVVARSVLMKGALTHRYQYLPSELGELKSAVHRLMSLCANEKLSLPELAYRFVLAHPSVSSALVGTGRLLELEQTLGFAERGALPSALEQRVRRIVIRDQGQLNIMNWPSFAQR
jgi:aryl-alcohol dehydrogenase-like predicted oxidoreductase